ncbi:hypothetical protein [Mesorhizobium cantuariense]|uniref:Uncharacterized protein n=1 Tax=Mesorhizobium cantuariense TaxID=1300275 RepID=A0ABV7MNA1_9HYPH
MAKTALERKRESLDRKREALEAMPEATRSLPAEPFFKFVQRHHNQFNVHMALDVGGLPFPDLSDERGAQSTTGEIERGEYLDYGKYQGSIGRAELMVTAWIDAAQELAAIINDYKREAVLTALDNLAKAEPKGWPEHKVAIQEGARLHKILEHLDKTARVSIPTYEVKGI